MTTSTMVREPVGRTLLEQEMTAVESLDFASGQAVVYSARSPAKETPNEDAAALLPFGAASGVLIVADGAGGARSGGQAARLTIESLAAALEEGQASGQSLRSSILNGIENANRNVTATLPGAATTLAIAQVEEGVTRPFHVGDSTIVVLGQRGSVKHQTVPHGPVGYAVEAGMLDESEALHHAERHLVSNVVGSAGMRIEIGPALALAPRDTLLLASDGLSDNLYFTEIVERIRKGPLVAAGEALVRLSRRRMLTPAEGSPSKADDLTFVLFRRSTAAR